MTFSEFDIPTKYRGDWDKYKLWDTRSVVTEPVLRAYSMANYPEENNIVMLNVRIATAPAGRNDLPPGKMSSFIFNLKPGDKVVVSGPLVSFCA